MNKQTFVLNDETKVNQKGFRILNTGLDLERFIANPVILDSHNNDTRGVIGRWENIQIQGNVLTAEPVFDLDSEQGKKIANQVEKGFLKGCSLGIDPLSKDNFIVDDMGNLVLINGEVYEASIVAIPNNANALIKLYASDNAMNDNAEKEYLKPFYLQNDVIEKLQADLKQAHSDKDIYRLKYEELKKKDDDNKLKLGADLLEKAIKSGKITALMKPRFENLLKLDYEGTVEILNQMQEKISLTAMIKNTERKDNTQIDKAFWKLEDYRKYAPLELRDNPQLYNRLLEEYKQEQELNNI